MNFGVCVMIHIFYQKLFWLSFFSAMCLMSEIDAVVKYQLLINKWPECYILTATRIVTSLKPFWNEQCTLYAKWFKAIPNGIFCGTETDVSNWFYRKLVLRVLWAGLGSCMVIWKKQIINYSRGLGNTEKWCSKKYFKHWLRYW